MLVFHGCSWTSSVVGSRDSLHGSGQEYALHLEASNVPTLITNNVPAAQTASVGMGFQGAFS